MSKIIDQPRTKIIIKQMKKPLLKFLFLVLGVFNVGFGFSDIAPEDTQRSVFEHLRDVKIMPARADGRFAPNDLVTKAEALTFALRAGGITIPAEFDAALVPADVNPNSWFAPVVAEARKRRITNPDSVNFFPEQLTTKSEFLAFLFRATRVNFSSFMSKTRFVAPDVAADAWMAPHFRYAARFDVAHKTSDGLYLPFKNLSRREVAVLTFRQLRVFHGDAATTDFVELQARIRQFMALIQQGEDDEATKHLHKILTLSRGLALKKNDKDAVAAKALSRSFKHFVASLRAMKYGKKLQAIESLSLAENYAKKAAKKSDSVAPVARQVSQMVEETLDSFLTPRFAFNN